MMVISRATILLTLLTVADTRILRLGCKYDAAFKKAYTDTILSSGKLVEIPIKTIHSCVKKCLMKTSCKTFAVHTAKKRCMLFDKNSTDPGVALVPSDEWIFYQTSWTNKKIGVNCLSKSKCYMPNTEVCEDTCDKRGYRCICRNGYYGKNCKKIKNPNVFGPLTIKDGGLVNTSLINGAQMVFAEDACNKKIFVNTNLMFKVWLTQFYTSGLVSVTYLRLDTFEKVTHEVSPNPRGHVCLKYEAGSMMCRSTDASYCQGIGVDTPVPAIILSLFMEPDTESDVKYGLEGSYQEIKCGRVNEKPKEELEFECKCAEVMGAKAYCHNWNGGKFVFCYLAGGLQASSCPGARKSKSFAGYFTEHKDVCC